jgi:hypothetical protein
VTESAPVPPRPAQPPPLPDPVRRGIMRAVHWARLSAVTMLVLGVLSAAVGVLHPLTAGFLISVAVIGNGAIEWLGAKRLAALDRRAPALLAWNQAALGVEITAYAAWQLAMLRPEAIEALLARPVVSLLLGRLSVDEVELLLELMYPAVRMMYVAVAVVAVIGCAGTAWFYLRRGRYLGVSVVHQDTARGT